VEKELILKALKRFEGNQTKAATFLDVSRRTLIYRMEKHGIQRAPGEAAEATEA
jgi:two-component system NtrC family response regulator